MTVILPILNAKSIQQTSDGGYILAGSVMSYLIGATDAYDLWVLKLAANGDLMWHKMYRGGNLGAYNFDIANEIRQTADGGYIVAGQTEDAVGYGVDGLLMKLDSIGNIQWQKNYESGTGDSILTMGLSATGDVIVGGLYQNGGVVAGLNNNGEINWQKTYKFSNKIVFIEQTLDKGLVMIAGGSTQSGLSSVDYFVMKTDGNGNLNDCLALDNADLKVYDAALVADSFGVKITSPSLRIISTNTFPTNTDASTFELCPNKKLYIFLNVFSDISFNPAGLNCSDLICSGQYLGSTPVILNLYPEAGATFKGWGDDCSPCGINPSCQITMNADKICTVVLDALKGDIDGDGQVTLADAIVALKVISKQTTHIRRKYHLSGVDINNDSRVGMVEVLFILQKLADIR